MALKTVFLIEPDDYQRDIIHAALDHHGYQVVEIDWDDVATLPGERPLPDLLVAAHAGPGQSHTMMEWVRHTPGAAGIPIICVTDDAHPREMEEAIEAGCAVVYLKPLNPVDFAAQVRQLIGPSASNGFTLIEIAVALAIVALLTALLLPVVGDRLKAAEASQTTIQIANVEAAAEAFYLDMGRWPRELAQLVDAPGVGTASREDVFGRTIPPGDAPAWKGPYLDVATLPGDSIRIANGVITSPFLVSDWTGDDFFTIVVRDISRSEAVRISELVDADTILAIAAPDGGRVRWQRDTLFYLAKPVRR